MPQRHTGHPVVLLRAGAAAIALLLLQACAARPPEQPAPTVEPAPPPAPPAPTAKAPALDGRLIVDAQEYPWSAIGRLNFAGLGFCNGILIGPSQVLTQARCLYDGRDGRWWQPQEMHFIAAYQKDSFLADAAIARFTVAPGFDPAGGLSLANLASNWAVVDLSRPIGRQTGWLGLQWDSDELKAAAERGEAAYLRAGYRKDWPHAVSLHFGCSEAADTLAKICAATPTELALPAFVMTDGELRVLADHYLRSPAQGERLASLAAATLDSDRLGRATTPDPSGPVRRRPRTSVSLFLSGLGYDVQGSGLDAAVAAFLHDQGLPARQGADIDLLTALIRSAQNGGGHS